MLTSTSLISFEFTGCRERYLAKYRWTDPNIQHEYDKCFGLIRPSVDPQLPKKP